MPSGSKKRKSSKKPKPQGGPPELEAGLEEAMENDGVEVGEATPSPRGFEGDPEAMAERGLEGKEMNGEAPQEGDAVSEAPKEGFQTDEAAPDQDEGGQGDPPSQAEPEPEIPSGIEAEAPAVFELEGEPAQGETDEPQIDTPLMEFELKTDATQEEIKPETELDAVPVESEPDASPDEIRPDADIGLDEVELSKESSVFEREYVLDAAPIGNESGMDESYAETETKTVAASADIEPEIDKAPDEVKSEIDAAPAEVESEISEPLVEVKPEAEATPYVELETNDAPDEVPVEAELEVDGAPAESKPEMEEAQVEELEIASPADIEPETTEVLMERELETDVAPVEAEAEEARELAIDVAPTDVEAEAEEARELTIDATPVDVEPVTDAAPADTEAETDTAQVEIDASPDEILSEIDAASPENETVEIEPEVNAALVEAEQEEVSQAEIEAAPEPEPEVEALVEGEPEVTAEDVDNSAEIEAKTEPPQETEPEPKPLDVAEDTSLEPPQEIEPLDVAEATSLEPPQEIEPLDVSEDTSLEPPQEIEPESEVVATDEAKPADEASVETKAEERGSVETESDQQDLVEGEMEAPPEIDPEPEVETSRGIELEAEAEVPLEAESEPVVEAAAEVEPDEKGHIETVSDQQDLVEIEPDQSGVKEHDQQLQKQEREEDLGELDTSVSENNQPSESQPQVADTSVIEDEPPVISASDIANSVDDSTSSISSSDSSDNTDNQRTTIEQEPEEGDDIPPSATVLEGEGESTIEGVSDNQDSGVAVEQAWGTAVDNEQGDADEPPDESQEDISEQEKAVDVGHDEDGAVLASAGNGGETGETSEQEVAIELPLADVVDAWATADDNEQGAADELPGESKEDISEQERAVDVGHDEDGAVLASAGNGGEIEESSEQELAIELPRADVVDVAESAWGTAVDNEQGAADELPDEPKEDISEQERAVDVGHDEDGSVLASAGNGGEIEESSEQELAIKLPPADVVDVAESAWETAVDNEQGAADELLDDSKEDISEQERAVDVGHDEDRAVLASAGNGGEVEVASEQELGIELPPADVVDVEESAKVGPPPSDQEPVTEQPQPRIDEQDPSMGLGAAADEPQQSLNATLPSSESEMTSEAPEPQDEAITPANEENVASEHEFHLESACGELERDIGEEDAASSTVAEAGSVLNDFDERASCDQELPTDFTSTGQDVDIPDFKEFGDNLSTEAHESETGLREQLDSEASPAEKVDANAGCGLEATSEQQEVLLAGAEADKPAEDSHTALVSSDEQLLSSPQPEQVVQGEDKVRSSKEIVLANEELRTAEEERATCEDDKVAGKSIFGTSLSLIAGDELISKAFTYLENGQQSLSSSEGPSNELVEHIDESSVYQSEVNNMDKTEIHAMDTKELKEAEHNPMGGDTNYDADEAPVESASLIPEGRDMKGVQAFRQESTQEASLPVVVPAQDRALEHVSLKSAERPSGGGTLQRRSKLLSCCGMFDLLLRKN